MYSNKIANVILLVLAIMISVHGSLVPRQAAPSNSSTSTMARLFVIFFSGEGLSNASFSPDALAPATCITLPTDWLNRPLSISSSLAYTCTYYQFGGCEGSGTIFPNPNDNNTTTLPPSLYGTIESFFCTKNFPTTSGS